MKPTEIIDKVTLPIKYKLIITIGLGIVIFVPESITLKYMNIQITGIFRSTLGILFIIFLAFTIVEIMIEFVKRTYKSINRKIQLFKKRKVIYNYLYTLSDREQDYIYTFIRDNSITQNMPINDGITQSLVAKGLIFRSSNISSQSVYFPHNINKLVWLKLKKHPEILEFAVERSRNR